MESDTYEFGDDGTVAQIILERRRRPNQSNRCRCNMVNAGLACLGMIFFAVLVAATMYALAPNGGNRKSVDMPQKKHDADRQEVMLKAMFNTDLKNSESLNLIDTDALTTQLNAKLSGMKILVVDGFFRNDSAVLVCENALSGNVLQLNLIAFYPRQCNAQDENLCKKQFQEQLKDTLNQMLVFSLKIQFDNKQFENIDVQLCDLLEMTMPVKSVKSFRLLARSSCPLQVGTINLVQISGASGTRIYDDNSKTQLTVSLYEDMAYRLHIRFTCNRNSGDYNCDLSQNVNIWIDYNDNQYEDEGETQLFQRYQSNTNNQNRNSYDFELYIPTINQREIRGGVHRMRLTVTPDDEYERECGLNNHKETREYTVNIVPKTTYTYSEPAPVPVPVPVPIPIQVPAPTHVAYRNEICDKKSSKISFVIMAGERGTEIRDDNPAYDNRNYHHHLAVTIYEHTVYLLRVQLDCASQLDNELFDHGCNLAQDVQIWIDLNNDGRFDQSESGVPYTWPQTSYLPQGNYDLQLNIPLIDGQYLKTGKHQMRLTVQSSEQYRRLCGRVDYNETRDYTVNIIPRSGYIDPEDHRVPYVDLDHIVCTPAYTGKVQLLLMAGEHRTQIRDHFTDKNSNQQHQAIVLYENTVYLSRIQLDCHQQWIRNSPDYNCHLIYDVYVWIDFNNDGIYDSSENAVPFRWPLNSYTPKGLYDLQISIPPLGPNRIQTGPHRMQLVVTMNEFYRKKCGDNNYKEIRDYTVSIVANHRPAVDSKLPIIKLSDNVCSLPNAKLALVIMAGEQGTEIRDNILSTHVLRDSQNRHHLSVKLYESTIYRLRVTLDCHPRPSGGLPDLSCNLMQDVNVLIDLNNDQQFDEQETRIAQRWPLRSTMPLGIYDFEIEIPSIYQSRISQNLHRMRIVVKSTEDYYKKCGRTDFQDTREYNVDILPRVAHREVERYPPVDTRIAYCSVGNLVCSEGSIGISSVNLYGEQHTQIRDDFKTCNPNGNYHDRTDKTVTLFENSYYTLQIQTYCTQRDAYGSHCNQAKYIRVWIDFNNDGVFDEKQGELITSNSNEQDIRIRIPQINRRLNLNEHYRMRIIVTQDENNHQACYNTGYGEARDYTIRFLSKAVY